MAAACVGVLALVALPSHNADEQQSPGVPSGTTPSFGDDRGDPVVEEVFDDNRRVLIFIQLSLSKESKRKRQEVCEGAVLATGGSETSIGSGRCNNLRADADESDVAFDYLEAQPWGLGTFSGSSQ